MEKTVLQLFRFGSFYLLVRELDREAFGIWTLFLIICALFEVTRIGMVQNALVKFLAGTEERKIQARINTASLVIHIILTLVLSLILSAIARAITLFLGLTPLEDLLYWYILTSLALIPLNQFNFIQQAHLKFDGIFYSNVARQGVFLVYVLAGYFSEQVEITLYSLAMVQIIGAVFGSLVSWWCARKDAVFSRQLDRWWMRWLFAYGKYVVGTNLGSMFIKSIDQLMLGAMINPVAVALYGTAIKIGNLVEVPTQSLAAIVFPKSARRVERGEAASLKKMYEKSVGALLAIIVPVVIVVQLFAEPILMIIAGEQYLDAAPLLRITMLFGLFIPFARQFGTMMDALGFPVINFRLVGLSAGLNLVFNLILINRFGIMGAAYATLLTFTILFITNQIILYRKLKVQLFQPFVYAVRAYGTGWWMLKNKLWTSAKTF